MRIANAKGKAPEDMVLQTSKFKCFGKLTASTRGTQEGTKSNIMGKACQNAVETEENDREISTEKRSEWGDKCMGNPQWMQGEQRRESRGGNSNV